MKRMYSLTLMPTDNNSVKILSDTLKKVVLYIYSALAILIHFVRCFDNSFWGDEGLVILAARKNWGDMIEYVAENGHSPLYYAFAWLCVHIFGESGVVYHMSFALAYFIIVLVTAIVVRRCFGYIAAFITVTFCAMLDCAITYNLEVRMYTWCQLFIFLTFITAYMVHKTRMNRYYILLTLFSIGAVYSHYFALASIGIIYLFLLFGSKKDIGKVFLSGGTVIVALVPWLIYAKTISGVIMSNYSISLVPWKDCFEFIFKSKYSFVILSCFVVSVLLAFIYDRKIIDMNKNDKGIAFRFSCVKKNFKLNYEWKWIISGIFAVFGTISAAEIISHTMFPIIVLRYLYVSYIILWLIFGIVISKLKYKRLWAIVLIFAVLSSGVPTYASTLDVEIQQSKRLEATLQATTPIIDEHDFIYTDIIHLAWTVASVYYPKTPHDLFGYAEWWGPIELPEFDTSVDYWLFLSSPISDHILDNLHNQNCDAKLVVENGFIGTGSVWIYKVVHTD